MRSSHAILAFGIVTLISCGGGSNSSPTEPAGSTLPAAANFKITSISTPTYGTDAQTVVVTGTGFGTGMSAVLLPPPIPTPVPFEFSGFMLQNLTTTSFSISYKWGVVGVYTLTLKSASGETSAPFSITPQYRTAGATWIPEGARLTDVTAGFPGRAIADATVFQLNDGRWRMLMSAAGSIRSATSPDGLAWTMEGGTRFPTTFGGGQVQIGGGKVVRLDDGRIRYFGVANGATSAIYSLISADEGFTWTIEGVRLNVQPSSQGMSVVKLRDGRYRGYWSTNPCAPSRCGVVYSATSNDMLNWTQDAGVRIGTGAAVSGDGTRPKAIANADGSITLFYWGTRTTFTINTMASTASDGLSFTSESIITSLGSTADPEVVRVGSGLRMYYNWGDDFGGTIFSAISASGAPAVYGSPIR